MEEVKTNKTIKPKENTFETLNKINLSDKLKEKIGLKYLSWAYAWGELKKAYPDASYHIYSRIVKSTTTREIVEDGVKTTINEETENEVLYFTDGNTAHVKVGVTVEGVEYIECLPVMDHKNQAVRVGLVTSTMVNKAIQRAFVKACARHGLGLYVYAGEDLPEDERKTIDIKAIEAEANKLAHVDIDAAAFESIRDHVIAGIQSTTNAPVNISSAIVNYVTKTLPNVKISAATLEHSDRLRKIDYFITKVQEALDE